ncbi:ABC transporter substrate-binding protein [Brevibacterium sp. UBA7493]|uniref:ABC transporter substrate-binding protein n=1 Tax=Brevibacterium sp. UBA7493 TaxID=1946121 RepID=UPI00257B193E|nr:ABC transporter substrate-binding protein [Brevibacterium sp. UBA7493]
MITSTIARKRFWTAAAAGAALLLTAGCTVDESGEGTATEGEVPEVQEQELNQELHDQLPDDIKDAGSITSVNTGSFPPYTIVDGENNVTGASADLAEAMGQMLGIEIEHETVDGLASVLTGMDAGRYDLSIGPTGDFPERQEQATFIDWVQEYVVFAVQAGNPQDIDGLDTTCGKRIAVQAGGSAEAVIKEQSSTCEDDGDDAIEVQSYKDQPSAILSVQSGRADAFFSSRAPLTYFVNDSDGKLELVGTEDDNGFDDLYQGIMVPKDSEMTDIVLAVLEELHDNGTYDAIMGKWDLDANKLDTPGINLAK